MILITPSWFQVVHEWWSNDLIDKQTFITAFNWIGATWVEVTGIV